MGDYTSYEEFKAAADRARNRGKGAAESVVLLPASDVAPEPIKWIWGGWLAAGMLHLIAGAPMAGKTTVALSVAATISKGGKWPDKTKAVAGKILIWSSEDSLKLVIIPRLLQMGANLDNISFVHKSKTGDDLRPFDPAADMPALAAKAAAIGNVVLLLIDPVVAAVPLTRNSHNNAETRNGLQPVVDFAEATECAVLGITHFTKGTAGTDPVERITGSLAFGALPRVVWACAKTHETSDSAMPRICVRAKNNVGPSGDGFGFDLKVQELAGYPDVFATRVEWLGAIEGTAGELLAEVGEQKNGVETKTELARAFLKEILAKGDVLSTEVETEAAKRGITASTLKLAKRKEGVRSQPSGAGWVYTRDKETRE